MTQRTITDFQNLDIEPHIKTILLDLDNTCYEYEPCHTAALEKAQLAIEAITGPLANFSELYAQAQQQVKKRIPTDAASHSRILYFQALFELLERTDAHHYIANLEHLYWETFMSTMQKTTGLDDFLARSRKNGTTVVVVSDLTTTIQCKKLLALGIADKIDFLVTAEEVGEDKPDPTPFLVALEKVHGNPKTAVVIGDNYERDIEGANALGIQSILITHDTSNKTTPLR